MYCISVLLFIFFTDLNWTLFHSWSECLLNKKTPQNNKQTKANLLGSFEYYNGNWISVTGWLVTVQRVMGVFVARVLAMTSSWIERGSSNRWSALFLCPSGLWSHTTPSALNFVQNISELSHRCEEDSLMWTFCICKHSFLLAIYKNLFYIQFPTVLYQEWPVAVSGHILHPGGLSTTQTVSFSLCRCSTSCQGSLHDCLNLRLLQMTPLSQAGLLGLLCRQSGELLVHPTGNK